MKKKSEKVQVFTLTAVNADATDNSETAECDFEEMLVRHVGGWGPYQWRYLLVFAIVTLELAYVTYSPLLYLYIPSSYWCSAPPELSNLTLDESFPLFAPYDVIDGGESIPSLCRMYDVNYTEVAELYLNGELESGNSSWPVTTCRHGWSYNYTGFFESAATDMNFVCENEWKGSLSQSLFFVGATVGVLLFGYISDHYGRFKTFLLANLLLLTTGISTPFCAHFHEIAFFMVRFAMGLTHNAYLMTFYMLSMEYVSNDKRSLVGNLSLAIWMTVGGTYQPWLIKALGEWRTYHHILFAQVAIVFLTPFILDESCRWLISKGRIDESVNILRKIAKVNKKTVEEKTYQDFRVYAQKLKEETEKESASTILDLFRTKRIRRNTILMMITWMLISVVFDGHIRNISNLNYSIYITCSIAFSLELPADLFAIWGIDNLGRRWSAAGSLVLSSIAMTVCIFFLDNGTISLILAMIGRFFITYAMSTGVQISLEIVPTQLRGQGSGMANVAAQASTFFSPYIAYLSNVWEPFPFVLLSAGGFLAALAAVFLPETAGKDLPNTIEEAENFGLDQKFFYLPVYHDRLRKRAKTVQQNEE